MNEKGVYKCTKCEVPMSSKCAGQRAIFIDLAHTETRMFNLDNVVYKETRNQALGYTEVMNMAEVSLPYNTKEKSPEEGLKNLIDIIREATDRELEVFICYHDWELLSATCQLGCCKRTKQTRRKKSA